MSEGNTIVVVYDTPTRAEAAVKQLQGSGFDIRKVSILGRGHHAEEEVAGYYSAVGRTRYWGRLGAFWDNLWSFLDGAAVFIVPGIGPVLIGGPVVTWVAGTLEADAAVEGLSVVGSALYNLGIPKNNILRYESALRADRFLLIAYGGADVVLKAKEALRATRPDEVNVHFEEEAVMSMA
jgi:hypothetical protein